MFHFYYTPDLQLGLWGKQQKVLQLSTRQNQLSYCHLVKTKMELLPRMVTVVGEDDIHFLFHPLNHLSSSEY